MEYLPQANNWIEKQKVIEADASKERSKGHKHHRRHMTHRAYKHHRRHKTHRRYKR